MAEPWPATLPQPMLAISGGSPADSIFTDPEFGPNLARKRTVASSRPAQFRLVLRTTAQYQTFNDFWRGTLHFGAVPTALDLTYTDVVRDVRIKSYQWQNLGGGRYEITGEAEIMPGGG